MEQPDIEAFRRDSRRTRAIPFWLLVFISVTASYRVAVTWTFLGGAAVGAILLLICLELHLALDRARWLKRFPELADTFNTKRSHQD